jgi:predicted GIY-YIG superfamily endonuclease
LHWLTDAPAMARVLRKRGLPKVEIGGARMDWITHSYSFTHLSIMLHAPAQSGVYLLRTSSRCIYVGDTDDLRKTLLAHLRGDIPWITLWAPRRFSFIACSERQRADLKAEAIERWRPVIGAWSFHPTGYEPDFEVCH